ncbi:ABC transporter substrate-binding protein [Paenibacillus hamazuiensis]|uniref:ABC transporter substrate-binding protein n=1 Tax=Paenibacillus hamazuiensis TaxID=2936508 RepID=UPI0020101F79|nr:ABC transporter substrate-binding protein [Paenibacillus hamazuiensis]
MFIKRERLIVPLVFMLMLTLSGCLNTPDGSAEQATANKEWKPENQPPVEIWFWNPFGGGEGDFAGQIIQSFNASQKQVFVKQLRLESNEYYVKLSTALSSGKGPDVAVVHADRILPFVKAKQITSLDSLAGEAGFDFRAIEDANMRDVIFQGKPYAVPIDTHFHMLYYNKTILQKAGLLNEDDTPKLGELSPEGFIRMLRQIQTKVPGVQPFAVNTPFFQEPFLDLYYEAGGDLLSPDMTKAAINNEKALSVLKFYQQLYANRLTDLSDKTPWDSFHEGKAALWFGGVWEAGHHLSEKSLQAGIMPLPPIFGSPMHWGSSHTLVVPAYVKKEKRLAAMTFMKYFSEVGGTTWGEAGHVPANRAVVQSEAYRQMPYRKLFIEARHHVKFAPQSDKYTAIYTTLSEDLQSIVLKGLDPQEGLAALEKKINDILAY